MMENGFARNNDGKCLETVRALHKTVVALRTALEESKNEILELKSKVWPIDSLEDTIKCLSVENHALKNQLSDKNVEPLVPKETRHHQPKIKLQSNIKIRRSRKGKWKSIDNLQNKQKRKLKIHKTISLNSFCVKMSDQNKIDEDENDLDQDQEVDDIELIFTTDETKESDFKEQLVSIDDANNLLHVRDLENCRSDRELDDDVFCNDPLADLKRENSHLFNSKSDNSINHEEKSLKSCYSYQDSSFENKSLEKDESFDRFEEKIRIVETDISKCGIQDIDYNVTRRNTCPNPLQYRPLAHRDALKFRKMRPILNYTNTVRKESGAQTDISALPTSAWLSESNLANEAKSKLGDHFPTLPSKFPMPDGSRLRLSEKTVEARRVLLSDIGFTSMVPELSRSADHLYPNNNQKPVVTYGQYLRTTDFQQLPGFTSQKFIWTTATTRATPSDQDSYPQSRYNSMFPLLSPTFATSQHHSNRRCSAPGSPSKCIFLRPNTIINYYNNKLRFANGSLPELRSRDWTFLDNSGDSTDSLVDEAESYLRRSIDCVMTNTKGFGESCSPPRRASAPDSSSDNVPPQGWQPFLPRNPRDLKLDHWVKVITSEGKVRGGRIRYIGPLIGQLDQFIGVQLSSPEGNSDGTFNNRRYFQCEPYHGIFVLFKKVIMGWRP